MSDAISQLTVPPSQREHLTLDALDAAESVALGEWTITDARALLGDEALVHGLMLYAQLLETMLALARGIGDVGPVREAARVSARAWRKAAS